MSSQIQIDIFAQRYKSIWGYKQRKKIERIPLQPLLKVKINTLKNKITMILHRIRIDLVLFLLGIKPSNVVL